MALDISQDTVGIAWMKLPLQNYEREAYDYNGYYDDSNHHHHFHNDNNSNKDCQMPMIQSVNSIPWIPSSSNTPFNNTQTNNSSFHSHTRGVLEHIGHTIHSLIKKESIQGFIVGWPLQPHGQPGFECGRVLYLLDSLVAHTSHYPPLIHKHRPLALWDKRSLTHGYFLEKNNIHQEDDVWKRSNYLYCLNSNNPRMDDDDSTSKTPLDTWTSKQQIYPCQMSSKDCATSLLQQFTSTVYVDIMKSSLWKDDCEKSKYEIGKHKTSLLWKRHRWKTTSSSCTRNEIDDNTSNSHTTTSNSSSISLESFDNESDSSHSLINVI